MKINIILRRPKKMKKWSIVHNGNIEALKIVFAAVSEYIAVSCIHVNELTENVKKEECLIYLGTDKTIDVPKNGYRIKVYKNEYGNDTIVLNGDGYANELYSAVDFKNKYLVKAREKGINNPVYYFENIFKKDMPEYDEKFKPYINERALWTWGYVIYDYKGYIDNMLKLKLNMLIIWNDYPPVNAEELVAYAHKKGIKVIWGFSWGWGTNCMEADVENLDAISDEVVEKYERDYANLNGDGIYFQTFTETENDTINGKVIAEAAVSLVNKTADRILTKYPDLKIQFGLHAMSVKNKTEYIKNVDERVLILWEDCGAFPFSNMPFETEGFEETMEFADKIKNLRNAGFGELYKGMSRIDWGAFEHQPGPYVIGEYDKNFVDEKTKEKHKIWKYIQAYWISNAKYVKEKVEKLNADTLVAALVEDGLFDKKVWYPAALYAEILWNPKKDIDEILKDTALMTDVSFA